MKNNTAAAPEQPQLAGPTPARQADRRRVASWLCAAGLLLAWPVLAWEPSAAVELVVPAGAGGGADQMARLIQQTVTEHKLMRQPLSVVNRPGNSGIDGLMELKAARGNPHKLLISLSNLFTAPLAAGADFHWRDITPVQLMALDQFVLWVNTASPYKTPQELLAALRAGAPGSFKLGGTGSRQEDQLISVLLETAAATRISYVPLKGGGDVARALANHEVDLTVNNPIEAEQLWRSGALRPLCVFDGRRLDTGAKAAPGAGWADLPTCMAVGIPVQYLMMRGIFTSPGATPEQVAYYNQLLDQVRALTEWKAFIQRGALNPTVLQGQPFADWLDKTDKFHRVLMREAGFKAVAGGAVPAATTVVAPKKN